MLLVLCIAYHLVLKSLFDWSVYLLRYAGFMLILVLWPFLFRWSVRWSTWCSLFLLGWSLCPFVLGSHLVFVPQALGPLLDYSLYVHCSTSSLHLVVLVGCFATSVEVIYESVEDVVALTFTSRYRSLVLTISDSFLSSVMPLVLLWLYLILCVITLAIMQTSDCWFGWKECFPESNIKRYLANLHSSVINISTTTGWKCCWVNTQ